MEGSSLNFKAQKGACHDDQTRPAVAGRCPPPSSLLNPATAIPILRPNTPPTPHQLPLPFATPPARLQPSFNLRPSTHSQQSSRFTPYLPHSVFHNYLIHSLDSPPSFPLSPSLSSFLFLLPEISRLQHLPQLNTTQFPPSSRHSVHLS